MYNSYMLCNNRCPPLPEVVVEPVPGSQFTPAHRGSGAIANIRESIGGHR